MRQYVKPELYCESFELSQHIAACGIDVKSADEHSCQSILDGDFWGGMSEVVFSDGGNTCAIDSSAIEAYCYTTGTDEAGKLFNS